MTTPRFMHFLQQVVVQQSVRDNLQVLQEASPIPRVNSEAPPFLIVHGNADSIIPVSQARDFFQALRDVSSECVAHAELPGAHHGFDLFNSRRTAEVSESVTEFLGVVLGQHRTARRDTRLPRPTRQT